MKKFTKRSSLFLVAYLIALPVLNALHFSKHDHNYFHQGSDQPLVSETIPDCDFCYIYQNLKVLDSKSESIFSTTAFSSVTEVRPVLTTTVSRASFNLRAPPYTPFS